MDIKDMRNIFLKGKEKMEKKIEKDSKKGGKIKRGVSIEEVDRTIELKNKLKKYYKNASLKNMYIEEEKEKSFGPVTNELKNVVNAVNKVKEGVDKTDSDIQKMIIPTYATPYKPRNPELLRLAIDQDNMKTPISSPRKTADNSPMPSNIILGENAQKYLPTLDKNNAFGIHFKENIGHMIGKDRIVFDFDDIILNGKKRIITPGMWELLCATNPKSYTIEDYHNYARILIETDSIYQNNDKSTGKPKSSSGDKYMKYISPIWKKIKENKQKKPSTPTESQSLSEGEGLKRYSEDRIEYKYIHNLSELLKRLYFIASEENAGHNNFDNEKINIVHFFSSELEKLAVTPQGIEYLISYVSSLPERIVEGSGLMNNLLNSKFMPEIHWPGYNYLGPFTDLDKNRKPVNRLDEAAMNHDYFYKEHKDINTRHIGDKILENEAWDRYLDPSASIGEKAAAFVTANAMKAKVYFGMGII